MNRDPNAPNKHEILSDDHRGSQNVGYSETHEQNRVFLEQL